MTKKIVNFNLGEEFWLFYDSFPFEISYTTLNVKNEDNLTFGELAISDRKLTFLDKRTRWQYVQSVALI